MAYKHHCQCGEPIPAARWNVGYHYCKNLDCYAQYGKRPVVDIETKDWYGRKGIVRHISMPKMARATARLTKVNGEEAKIAEFGRVRFEEACCIICGNNNADKLAISAGTVTCRHSCK